MIIVLSIRNYGSHFSLKYNFDIHPFTLKMCKVTKEIRQILIERYVYIWIRICCNFVVEIKLDLNNYSYGANYRHFLSEAIVRAIRSKLRDLFV